MKTNNLMYLNIPLEELKKIEPYWAIKENLHKLIDENLHPSFGKYEIVFVNSKVLIAIADFGEVDLNSLFTGESLNDDRVCRILSNWSQKKHLDPPTISISESTNKITFEDGRHRAKLSYFLGIEEIPVAIYRDDLNEIIETCAVAEVNS